MEEQASVGSFLVAYTVKTGISNQDMIDIMSKISQVNILDWNHSSINGTIPLFVKVSDMDLFDRRIRGAIIEFKEKGVVTKTAILDRQVKKQSVFSV